MGTEGGSINCNANFPYNRKIRGQHPSIRYLENTCSEKGELSKEMKRGCPQRSQQLHRNFLKCQIQLLRFPIRALATLNCKAAFFEMNRSKVMNKYSASMNWRDVMN